MSTDLATKRDLSEMETCIIKWNIGAVAMLTAIFAGVVKWL